MRKGGGKGKGSGFEREIAKKIAKAFRNHGIVQRDCWRSVLSGGHMISAGDLAISDRLLELFPFAIECKFYKKIHWWHLLIRPSKRTAHWKEHQWLLQAVEGSEKRKGLFPVLVMKCNHGPTMVAVRRRYMTRWEFMEFTVFLKLAVAQRL